MDDVSPLLPNDETPCQRKDVDLRELRLQLHSSANPNLSYASWRLEANSGGVEERMSRYFCMDLKLEVVFRARALAFLHEIGRWLPLGNPGGGSSVARWIKEEEIIASLIETTQSKEVDSDVAAILDMVTEIVEMRNANESVSRRLCEAVLVALSVHYKDILIAESGLRAVISLLRYPVCCTIIAPLAYVRVIRIAEEHIQDGVATEWALRVLLRFSSQLTRQLADSGGCELCAQALQLHLGRETLVSTALQLVRAMLDCEGAVAETLVGSGICASIDACIQWAEKASLYHLQLMNLRAVSRLVLESDHIKASFLAVGLHERLAEWVEKDTDIAFTRACCSCISALTWKYPPGQELVGPGLCRPLVQFLRSCRSNGDCLAASDTLRAIRSLSYKCETNILVLHKYGCCNLLVDFASCAENNSHSILLQWVWHVVAAFAEAPASRQQLVQLGVVELLCKCLQNCDENNCDVTIFCCQAIGKLCISDLNIAFSLESRGATATLAEHLKEHGVRRDDYCQECLYCIGALCSHAEGRDIRNACIASEIPDLVTSVLSQYIHSEAILEQALFCISKLLQDAERPSGENAVKHLMPAARLLPAAISTHIHNERIAELGLQSIFLVVCTGNQLIGGDCGVVQAVLSVLQNHGHLDRLVFSALKTAIRLCIDPSCISEMQTAHVQRVLELQLHRHCTDNAVLTHLSLLALNSAASPASNKNIGSVANTLNIALNQHYLQEDIVLSACRLIKTYAAASKNDEERLALQLEEVALALTHCLRFYCTNTSVVIIICETIQVVGAIDTNGLFRHRMIAASEQWVTALRTITEAAVAREHGPLIVAISNAMASVADAKSKRHEHQLYLLARGTPRVLANLLARPAEPAVLIALSTAIEKTCYQNKLLQQHYLESGCIQTLLQLLEQRHQKDKIPELVAAVAQALGALCDDFIEGGNAVGTQGVIILVKTLEMHHFNASAAGACCYAICKLRFQVAQLDDGRACRAVLATLHEHKRSESTVACVLAAVYSIAETEQDRRTLGRSHACELVMAVLKFHINDTLLTLLLMQSDSSSKQVSIWGCNIIYQLSRTSKGSRDRRQRFVARGGCQVIAKVFLKFTDDMECTLASLRAAAVLIEGQEPENTAVIKTFAQLGCLGVCIDCLIRYPANRSLIIWIFRLIAIFSRSSKSYILELEELGAVEIITASIMLHYIDTEIALPFCDIAAYFTHGKPLMAARLGHAGCCEALVSILSIHHNDADVSLRAAKVIANLSWSRGCQHWLGRIGAHDALLLAQRTNDNQSAELAEGVFIALGNLASGNVSNKERCSSACTEVIKCLENSKEKADSASTVRACALAIYKLSERSAIGQPTPNVDLFRKLNAGQVICDMLARYTRDTSVVAPLLRALGLLLQGQKLEQAMNVSQAPHLIAQCLSSFPRHEGISRAGCIAAKALVEIGKQEELYDAGCWPLVCAALSRHLRSLDACGAALAAISVLVVDREDSLHVRLGISGLSTSILEALRLHHRTSTVITQSAGIAIRQLCQDKNNRAKFVLSGCVEIFANTLEYYSTNGRNFTVVGSLLLSLAEVVRHRVAQEQVCLWPSIYHTVVQALNRSVSGSPTTASNDVATCTAGIITSLSRRSPENQRRLGVAGATKSILRLLSRGLVSESADLLRLAVTALWGLCEASDENRRRISDFATASLLASVTSVGYADDATKATARDLLDPLAYTQVT